MRDIVDVAGQKKGGIRAISVDSDDDSVVVLEPLAGREPYATVDMTLTDDDDNDEGG